MRSDADTSDSRHSEIASYAISSNIAGWKLNVLSNRTSGELNNLADLDIIVQL